MVTNTMPRWGTKHGELIYFRVTISPVDMNTCQSLPDVWWCHWLGCEKHNKGGNRDSMDSMDSMLLSRLSSIIRLISLHRTLLILGYKKTMDH